ncbi:OLC1v1010219C1 [Oldenlandia corymbosa var. corymbosa]|uniref:OLC1v1010219C1 n=1 Tax=Oldenlandia corymbosa var. corymbosa TaxID=529605 RepID=A0AAV1DQV1_OLDCO|nr:OLC1v1010219C1 [Oldenlandia corymbosa var. corymbosa]
MDPDSGDSANPQSVKDADVEPRKPTPAEHDAPVQDTTSVLSTSAISSWAKGLKLPQPLATSSPSSQEGNSAKSAFSRLTSGFGLSFPSKQNESAEGKSANGQSGVFESFTKGIVDSSLGAVKAVQLKARHVVSQNKRRYQEGGFDLDMTYITENIIAMGFPAGDMSSGFFGFVEGFYRNHMEEVIKFFETHHKGKYKVYNLCSERLYDASLFQGKVASFPFDDHNCPPIHLIKLFCHSAYSWLKEDILNVVVVHCKAGMARTGLMICSLLLFLKFFPTAEECIEYYNQKRCVDGKGLILPSQIRYVKYFERIMMHFNGETPPGRRCMLRGFRLHNCPYWIRPSITISNHSGVLFTTKKHPKTKDLMPEYFWLRSAKKGIVVFALPGEPGLTELIGDFKITFHEGQGDFYCWLNTTMMENRLILDASQLDGFDKRKLPSPGFQVEIVMIDYNGTLPMKSKAADCGGVKGSDGAGGSHSTATSRNDVKPAQVEVPAKQDNDDDVFSDDEAEESAPSRRSTSNAASGSAGVASAPPESGTAGNQIASLTHNTEQLSLESKESNTAKEMRFGDSSGDIKAIAADASVFSFGDEEDYESE